MMYGQAPSIAFHPIEDAVKQVPTEEQMMPVNDDTPLTVTCIPMSGV